MPEVGPALVRSMVVLSLTLLSGACSIRPVEAQASIRNLVVIDAGHGGVDPGARGQAGNLEKTIALRVARALAAVLSANPGLEVRLTRETDVLVPLAERPRLANLWRGGADAARPALFISIHTNAHESRAVRGFETYFLSDALTEDARRVAAMENDALRYESEPQADDPLSFILNDLRQNHYLRESAEGASLIQRSLASAHPGPNRGVKQAGFVVLNGSFMPAVLVEIGFISNPQEEALLASPDYQQRVARQLADAVGAFFGRTSLVAAPTMDTPGF